MIDFDALKSFLPDYVENITGISPKNRDNYICPLCGSGSKGKGTGGFSILNNDFWQCFACGEHGDIVDLYAKHNQVSNTEAAQELARIYLRSDYTPKQQTTPVKKRNSQTEAKQTSEDNKPPLTSFFLQATENLTKPEYTEVLEYLHKRGINDNTIRTYRIGAQTGSHNEKRVIIPRSAYSCLRRAISPENPAQKLNYKGYGIDLFNKTAFNTEKDFVFVVEGEFDALSLLQEGLPAIATCTKSNVKALRKHLEENPTNKKIYVITDNDIDKEGNDISFKFFEDVKNALEGLNLSVDVLRVPEPYKDVNELYTADLGLFMTTFDIGNKEKRELQEQAAGNTIYNFLDKVTKERVLIPTGLEPLDKILHGGLSNELYTISAMPGAGKTALISYIADNISAAGHPVIYFSLEVPKEQIQARGLSRLSFMLTGRNTTKAVAYSDVLYDYENLTDEKKQVLFECMELYKKNAQNLFIEEPENPYLEDLVNTCKRYKQILGKTPVVVIDYLQLLQPKPSKENRYTDKRAATEKVVQEIRQLAKIEKMPVLVISSLNRDGYGEEVKMESQKETGLIEYAAALMLGLYYTGMDDLDKKATRTQIRQWDAETPRRISLDVLKIRNGAPVKDPLRLEFYSAYNYFRPC